MNMVVFRANCSEKPSLRCEGFFAKNGADFLVSSAYFNRNSLSQDSASLHPGLLSTVPPGPNHRPRNRVSQEPLR